jgi:hypothetical protein
MYYPLKRRDLENIIDVDSAVRRVEAISTSPDVSEADRRLVSELLIAFDQGSKG